MYIVNVSRSRRELFKSIIYSTLRGFYIWITYMLLVESLA